MDNRHTRGNARPTIRAGPARASRSQATELGRVRSSEINPARLRRLPTPPRDRPSRRVRRRLRHIHGGGAVSLANHHDPMKLIRPTWSDIRHVALRALPQCSPRRSGCAARTLASGQQAPASSHRRCQSRSSLRGTAPVSVRTNHSNLRQTFKRSHR